MLNIPDKIRKIIGDRTYTIDSIGMSDSQVIIFDDMVLKIQPENVEARNEIQMMKWLNQKLPVPKILCYEEKNGLSYLLMSKIEGKMSCDEVYMKSPELLIQILTDGLKQLWAVDISDCPCNTTLANKLEIAKYNIEHGLVDVDDCEPDTYGENGFASPEELLKWLVEHQPSEELVLSHGDYCLPNIFAQDDSISGFIDFGRAGIADKWLDIALCYRSLKHNFDGTYDGITYDGFEPNLLFAKLGIEPDWEKIKYYILLDELF